MGRSAVQGWPSQLYSREKDGIIWYYWYDNGQSATNYILSLGNIRRDLNMNISRRVLWEKAQVFRIMLREGKDVGWLWDWWLYERLCRGFRPTFKSVLDTWKAIKLEIESGFGRYDPYRPPAQAGEKRVLSDPTAEKAAVAWDDPCQLLQYCTVQYVRYYDGQNNLFH